MTVAPEVTNTDVAVSGPRWPAVTDRRFGRVSAKSVAHVAATAVMWLIVLAVITVV
jgi:hypothetical protein